MAQATKFTQPMAFTGKYVGGYWAGYRFKEKLTYGSGGIHTGIDYNWGGGAADLGKQVWAIANGVVTDSTYNGFGNVIIVRHELSATLRKSLGAKKYAYSRYMHLNDRKVGKGATVKIGQLIGHCGKTGTVASHLHIDLWTDKHGLKNHMRYDKHTPLSSYVDPYLNREA